MTHTAARNMESAIAYSRTWGQIRGKIVADEVSLSFGQGNSGESNSTWFHDRLTEGYKRSFRAEGGGQSALEEAFSRSVKIGKVLAWVNSLLKRLFLTRNCLKLVYTRTGGTSEIDSPPPRPSYGIPNAFNFSSRLRLFPTARPTTRPSAITEKSILCRIFSELFKVWDLTYLVFRVNTKCLSFSFIPESFDINWD